MKWRSIKVNVRFSLINSLRYLTFSSVYAVFGRSLPGFRSVPDPHSSTRLQIAFTEQSFQPFSGNLATIVRYQKPSFCNVSIRALSSYAILPITTVIGVTAIMTWNIEKFITKRWYLLLSYFNNKIDVFVQLWNSFVGLRFRQFDMSSKYSRKQYISAQYCDKQISETWCKNIRAFLRYSNFRVEILIHSVSLASHVSTHLLTDLSAHLYYHYHSHHPSLLHSFTPGSKPTFSTNPSHLRLLLPFRLPSWQRDWTGPITLIVLFLFYILFFCLFRVVD